MASSPVVIAFCGLVGVIVGLLCVRYVLQDQPALALRSTRSGALQVYAGALFAGGFTGLGTAAALWTVALLVDFALVDLKGALVVTAGTLAFLYLAIGVQTFRTYGGRRGAGLGALGGALLLAAFWLPIGVATWFRSRPRRPDDAPPL